MVRVSNKWFSSVLFITCAICLIFLGHTCTQAQFYPAPGFFGPAPLQGFYGPAPGGEFLGAPAPFGFPSQNPAFSFAPQPYFGPGFPQATTPLFNGYNPYNTGSNPNVNQAASLTPSFLSPSPFPAPYGAQPLMQPYVSQPLVQPYGAQPWMQPAAATPFGIAPAPYMGQFGMQATNPLNMPFADPFASQFSTPFTQFGTPYGTLTPFPGVVQQPFAQMAGFNPYQFPNWGYNPTNPWQPQPTNTGGTTPYYPDTGGSGNSGNTNTGSTDTDTGPVDIKGYWKGDWIPLDPNSKLNSDLKGEIVINITSEELNDTTKTVEILGKIQDFTNWEIGYQLEKGLEISGSIYPKEAGSDQYVGYLSANFYDENDYKYIWHFEIHSISSNSIKGNYTWMGPNNYNRTGTLNLAKFIPS